MKNYSKDMDYLLALITHLALTKYLSRSPKYLSIFLGLNENKVEQVLNNYSGIFRKSQNKGETSGQFLFTLHSRYALRGQTTAESEELERDPLSDEQLSSLITFISNMQVSELNRKLQLQTVIVPVVCSIIAAAAALYIAYQSQL